MRNIFYFSLVTILILLLANCTAQQNELPPANTLSEDQLALDSLANFLESLHNGKYDEAARFYGGTYETMIDQNPAVNPNDHAALLRNACTLNGMQCLQVKSVSLEKMVSDTEFVFKVDFLKDGGTLFELGPCCGGDETNSPPQSLFYLRVLKLDINRFSVLDTPPYAP